MKLLETEDLLIFAKVVVARSVSRAAAELGAPRATVSRKLAALEKRLGVRLLQRTTRTMRLTGEGQLLYRHAEIVLEAARQAEASVRCNRSVLSGELRVSMSPVVGCEMSDVIADFAHQHPEVLLQLHVSTRALELQRAGFDAVIRTPGQRETGLVRRTLGRVSLVGVAAPCYLAAHGTPKSLPELREHRCLMALDDEERPQTHWSADGTGVALSGGAFSNDPQVVLRLVQRGLGIGMLPEGLVTAQISRGELSVVLPKSLRLESEVEVAYAKSRSMPRQVRAFVEWVVDRGPVALTKTSVTDNGGR